VVQAGARRHDAAIDVLQVGHVHPVGHGVVERDLDAAARPAPLAREEGLQHRLVGVHAAGDVADRDGDPARLGRGAGQLRQTRFRLHQQVVGLEVGQRPALAVAGDVAGDQPRVLGPQRRAAQAEPAGRSRRQVLDEDVGACDQAAHQHQVLRLLQIDAAGFLAAVEPDEIGALALHVAVVAPREVALRPLQLDHPRPGVGQARGAVGRGHRLFQGDHQQAFEIARHPSPFSAVLDPPPAAA